MHYAELFSFSAEWVAANVYSVVTALVVLLVGLFAASQLARLAERWLRMAPGMDDTIAPILKLLIRYAVIAITIVIVLGQFGVETASILAVLGAVGLAIALALQGTLSNIASGILLLWLRPFNVGEYVDAGGIAGTVLEVGLFNTRLRTFDGIATFAPNSLIWNSKITNYTREPTRMIDTKIAIAYSASIEKARITLLAIVPETKALTNPPPSVYVSEVSSGSVNVVLRVWVRGPDWWETKTTLAERTKTALDAAGIEIPFDKLDVNLLTVPPPDGGKSQSV